MVNTYTTNYFTVSNGINKTLIPKDLVGVSRPVRVSNTKIKWRGITDETSSYDFERRENETGNPDGSASVSASIPLNSRDVTLRASFHMYDSPDDGKGKADAVFDTDGDGIGDVTKTFETKYSGGTTSTSGDSGATITATVQNFRTTSDSDYEFSDMSAIITWEEETTSVEETTSPEVSGDMSASYSGVLTDNEETGWIDVSGFSRGENNVTYNIGGSGRADFKLQFDWEYETPEAQAIKKLYVNGEKIKLPLVYPSAPELTYDIMRTKVNGETLTADLVDVDSPDASPYRIYTPQHGILAWREYAN